MSIDRQTVSVALVGCGPRGLSVLERLVFRALAHRLCATVHVIEPGTPGVGIHHRDQPEYLRLHATADKVTAFVDENLVEGGGIIGPSLFDWARSRDVHVRHVTGARREVQHDDHLPRALLGDYLAWAAEYIASLAPPGLSIVHHRDTVVSVFPAARGEQLVLSAGGTLVVDHVVLAVGHSPPSPWPVPGGYGAESRWIAEPYPLPATVAGFPAGATVGLVGTGLVAADLVCALTTGRGGMFSRVDQGLRYHASGQEPTIVLIDHSGVPTFPRPRTSCPDSSADPGLPVARYEWAHRAQRPSGSRHGTNISLVQQEMRRRLVDHSAPDALVDEFLAGSIPARARDTVDTYRQWYRDQLVADLREADRAVVGPDHNRELIALLEAGVVRLAPGPEPLTVWNGAAWCWTVRSTGLLVAATAQVDYLVAARIPMPELVTSTNPLIRWLARAGRLRPKIVGGRESGVDVSVDDQPFDRAGRVQTRMYLLSSPAEHVVLDIHYVVSPTSTARVVREADRVVKMICDDTTDQPEG